METRISCELDNGGGLGRAAGLVCGVLLALLTAGAPALLAIGRGELGFEHGLLEAMAVALKVASQLAEVADKRLERW